MALNIEFFLNSKSLNENKKSLRNHCCPILFVTFDILFVGILTIVNRFRRIDLNRKRHDIITSSRFRTDRDMYEVRNTYTVYYLFVSYLNSKHKYINLIHSTAVIPNEINSKITYNVICHMSACITISIAHIQIVRI